MPFVPQDELDGLHGRIDDLQERLRDYEQLEPLIGLARLLQDEIVTTLGEHPNFTTQQIGELAFKAAMDAQLEKANDDLVAEYQAAHRETLYARVLAEVRASDGPQIYAEVRRKIDADPALSLELRNSARKELAARAKDMRRQEITADQEQIVNEEAERQLMLDGYDVRLALDGKLDLTDPGLNGLLQPNDYMDIYCTPEGRSERHKLTLMWVQDATGTSGWCYVSSKQQLYAASRSAIEIPDDVFLNVGSIGRDMTRARDVILDKTLIIGEPLTLSNPGGSARSNRYSPHFSDNSYSSYSNVKPAIIVASDLRTRDLILVPGSS